MAANSESGGSKDLLVRAAIDKLKEAKKSDDELKNTPIEVDTSEEPMLKSNPEHRTEASRERYKEREKERERERDRERERERGREERMKARDRDRGRDSDRERDREESERDRDKVKDRSQHSKDRGKDSGMFTTSFAHQPDATFNSCLMGLSLIYKCVMTFLSNYSMIFPDDLISSVLWMQEGIRGNQDITHHEVCLFFLFPCVSIDGIASLLSVFPLPELYSSLSDRDYHSSSYSSREKDRHRHHSYA